MNDSMNEQNQLLESAFGWLYDFDRLKESSIQELEDKEIFLHTAWKQIMVSWSMPLDFTKSFISTEKDCYCWNGISNSSR